MKTADREAELELMFNESRLKMVHYKSLINETAGKWLQVFPRYKDLAYQQRGLLHRTVLSLHVGHPSYPRSRVVPILPEAGCVH